MRPSILIIGNFINFPWTVVMRHQLLQCYEYVTDGSILDANPEIGPGKCWLSGGMFIVHDVHHMTSCNRYQIATQL